MISNLKHILIYNIFQQIKLITFVDVIKTINLFIVENLIELNSHNASIFSIDKKHWSFDFVFISLIETWLKKYKFVKNVKILKFNVANASIVLKNEKVEKNAMTRN